jgi:hypothetical protein
MRGRLLPVLLITTACGDDGPAETPYQQELRRATEACLREAKCLGREAPNLATCILSWTTDAPRYGRQGLLDCATSAGSNCDALLTCLNNGEPSESCDPVGYVPECTNTSPPVFLGCASSREFAVVCQEGTTCEAGPGPTNPCGVAPCQTGMTPPSCDDLTGQLLTCESAMLIPSECPTGLICEGGACVAPGDPCNAPGGMRCDGNVLTYCLNMRQATRDCAVTGHVCGVVGGEPACTTGPANEPCTSRGLATDCSGTTMTVCDDGNAYTFNCGQNGFACCGEGL